MSRTFHIRIPDKTTKHDSSGEICDRFASEDSRNIAIDQAKGTYLQFLDSDEWITPNATGLLVQSAQQYHCDMVISDFYRVVGDRVSHKGDIEDDCVLTREELAEHMIENPADFYYGVLWNKLYKRSIIEEHHLRMDTSISWCEDFMFNLEYIRHANIFYALQVPIYYYVKTKGSLASQGMSISKTIKMKLMVFEYYNNFYKHVMNDEVYEKNKLRVYRFLIDAAGDGAVPPAILPGSKKLGEERNQISSEAISSEGFLMDEYRNRKLLDYYLEPIAMKNDMTLNEARLLLYLNQPHHCTTRRELADFTNMSQHTLSMLLQKLSVNGSLILIEYFLVQNFVLMCNNRCTYRITGDIDCCSGHVKNTVNSHDQADRFYRKADRIKHHSQRYKTNTRNTRCSDRCQCCSTDYRQIIYHIQLDTEGLCCKYNRNSLHDRSTVHIDRCSKRNGKRRYLL